MAKTLRALTRVKEIRRALPHTTLNVRLARIAVLYEDLRLELNATTRRKISVVDTAGEGYRRLYFIRKAVGTIMEISGAFQRLDQCPEFRETRHVFSAGQSRDWREAVEFFQRHSDRFRHIRDDVGGHFLERAADYGLASVSDRAVGAVIIRRGSRGADTAGPILKFAGEIVAVAMTRNRGDIEPAEFYEQTLELLLEMLGHITKQVHVLTYHFIWPRFST